ncbi:MAG: tetratricopeptide repeat protein [Actinomycetota bacterium]
MRADLHERLATWLEEHGAELVELDEILGYHLEQACRYRSEIGLPYDDGVAAAARRRLTAAGRRALLRQDAGAATNLLGRAVALLVPGARDLQLELDLLGALFDSGDLAGAQRLGRSVAERAAAAGDRVGELCALLEEGIRGIFIAPEGAAERLAALAEQSLPVFEAAADDLALSTAYRALGDVANIRAQMDARLEAGERALIHLRRARIPHREDRLVYSLSAARLHGSTSVSELCEWLDEQEALSPQHSLLREARAEALAMLGRFDEARTILSGLRAELADRGAIFRLGDITSQPSVRVELLAGNPAAAVELGEEGCRLLEQIGEKSYLSTSAGMLAQALYALDRLEDADAWASRAAELGAGDDATTQMVWRQVKAKVFARRGELAEAERLAREAVAIGEETDRLDAQGDAYADLAEVLLLADKPEEAAAALEQALERYERKGNRVSTGRAQTRLADLEHAAPR